MRRKTSSRNISANIALVASAMLVATACDMGSDSNAEQEGAQDSELVISWDDTLVQLDPTATTQSVVHSVLRPLVYDTLVTHDPEGEIVPDLASSWDQIDDQTVEFSLQEGVTFHNGEPFNAEAVVFTIETAQGRDNPLSPFIDTIDSVEAIDEYVVRIESEQQGNLLANLTLLAMIPPEEYDEETFAAGGIGTGPFEFVSWNRGEELVLERNDDYWDGAAEVERVIYRPITEASTRMAAVQAGEVDIAFPVPHQFTEQISDSEGIALHSLEGIDTHVLSAGGKNEPWDDPDLRQAINLAVDRNAIVEDILGGVHQYPTSVISPPIFGYAEMTDLEHDPEQAQALIEDGGYGGLEVEIVVIDEQADGPNVAQAIASNLESVGLVPQVQVVPASQAFELLESGDFDLFYNTWATMTLDADFPLFRNYHPSSSREGVEDSEVADMLEAARSEADQDERAALYESIQEWEWESPHRMPLLHEADIWAVNENVVEGFTPDDTRRIILDDVTVSDD